MEAPFAALLYSSVPDALRYKQQIYCSRQVHLAHPLETHNYLLCCNNC